jgi:hypothetical protein
MVFFIGKSLLLGPTTGAVRPRPFLNPVRGNPYPLAGSSRRRFCDISASISGSAGTEALLYISRGRQSEQLPEGSKYVMITRPALPPLPLPS